MYNDFRAIKHKKSQDECDLFTGALFVLFFREKILNIFISPANFN